MVSSDNTLFGDVMGKHGCETVKVSAFYNFYCLVFGGTLLEHRVMRSAESPVGGSILLIRCTISQSAVD